jgi:hypothetical protein
MKTVSARTRSAQAQRGALRYEGCMTHRPGRGHGRHGDGPPFPSGFRPVRRRRPGWLVVSAGVTAVGLLMWFFVAVFVLAIADEMPVPVLLGVALLVAAKHRRRRRPLRLGAAGIAPLPHHPPPPPRPAPPRPEEVWARARERFARLRAEYAAHECDPMAVLRLPALSDVSVPSTGRFVEAFAEAQALETDAFPPESHATAFVTAVERADRSWRAACDAAERIRLSNLAPEERHAVERVIKLLTTARDSDNDAERLAAYARARTELARLDHAGVIHMPRTAQAALEVAGRGQLPA